MERYISKIIFTTKQLMVETSIFQIRELQEYCKPQKHLRNFLKTYCIDFVDLKDGDLVIDCGANVGDLLWG